MNNYLYVVTVEGCEGKKAVAMNLIERPDNKSAAEYARNEGEQLAERIALQLVESGDPHFKTCSARHECYLLVRVPT